MKDKEQFVLKGVFVEFGKDPEPTNKQAEHLSTLQSEIEEEFQSLGFELLKLDVRHYRGSRIYIDRIFVRISFLYKDHLHEAHTYADYPDSMFKASPGIRLWAEL
jgi:hypothetical protein